MSKHKTFLFSLFFFCLSGFCLASVSDSSLEGRWPLSEGRGTAVRDISGKGRNGTIVQPVWCRDESGENSFLEMKPEKNSFVSVRHNEGLNITGELTLSAWIFPTSQKDTQIISKGRSYWASGYNLLLTGKKIALWVCTENVQPRDRPSAYEITTGEIIEQNVWSHVAATYSVKDNSVKIYHNGKKVQESPSDGKISYHLYPASPLRLGVDAIGTGYFRFSGVMRDVKIYSRALSEAEIFKDFMETDTGSLAIVLSDEARRRSLNAGLRISVLDAETGSPTSARIYVKDAENYNLVAALNISRKKPEFSQKNSSQSDDSDISCDYLPTFRLIPESVNYHQKKD